MSEPLSIEQAREHFSELVESVNTKRERVTIMTPDGGEVVLMNAADLEGLEETLEILSDPAEVAAINQGSAEAERGELVDLDNLR